eukprot:CAMPEP_0203890706 /NCGR_PEP_ID=MMETSP0359-20131031/34095_1 /ASSEMBLY_ACC=CAM_ASM_000338 /TAXON_ID=268821 /ORGANISM="Scrippsiella Hangoei, Strain SHTV-5" /LENGTH=818 /DNA_ID=CAMNT_0050812371 /DNA_START=8 /DNA_END=2464 /DNA_ORIENTATION=+
MAAAAAAAAAAELGRGGNVQVAVRLRPFMPREKGQAQAAWVQSVTSVHLKVLVAQLAAPPKEEEKVFAFDHCFSSPAPGGAATLSSPGSIAEQQLVYEAIGKEFLLGNALAGYNSCLFAYGQTGSGKTHTVLGHERDPGIVPRLTAELFERGAAEYQDMRVSASFLEIYNEQLKDLLNPDLKRKKALYVHQHPQMGVYVPYLTEEAVISHSECMGLLDFGNKIRATSQTNMNSTSSRSHALFILRITCPINDGKFQRIRSSTLNLIDLAGSERVKKSGAEGQRMREGQNINSSLSVLGQVISKLAAEGKGRPVKHVPFRQSKLTYLLTDALSGNSRTLMVAAISPAADSAEETLGTLRFASSVKKVKTAAVQNEQEVAESDLLLQTMRTEVEGLRKEALQAAVESEDARRLESKAEAVEHAVRSMQTRFDPTSWGEARKVQANKRREFFQTLSMPLAIGGMLNDSGGDGLQEGVAANSPYLLNISDDISLAGRLLYFLPEGPPIGIGSSEDNRIRLLGLGIGERLCEISVAPGGAGVEVRYLCRGGRLVVDGQVVADGQPRPVRHGAKIVFGRAFAFRAVVPSLGGEALPDVLASARPSRSPSPEPDRGPGGCHLAARPGGGVVLSPIASSAGLVTPSGGREHPLCALLDSMPASYTDVSERTELLRQARGVQDDVDEANDLLREMEQPLQQCLEVSFVLRPALASDLSRAAAAAAGSGSLDSAAQPAAPPRLPRPPRVVVSCCKLDESGDGEPVAVWPLPRFYTHLEELRDKYQRLCDRKREGMPVDSKFGCSVAWGPQGAREDEDEDEEDDGEDDE